jgi:signal transduction histidine kinase
MASPFKYEFLDYFIPKPYFESGLEKEYNSFTSKGAKIYISRLFICTSYFSLFFSAYMVFMKIYFDGFSVDPMSLFRIMYFFLFVTALKRFKGGQISLFTFTLPTIVMGAIKMLVMAIGGFPSFWFYSQRTAAPFYIPLINLSLPQGMGTYVSFVYLITTLSSFIYDWKRTQYCAQSDASELPMTLFYCFIVLVFTLTFNNRTKNQRDIEHRLKQALESAEKANSAKTVFVSNISHDMRTPLQAIMGIVELLQETPLTPTQNTYLYSILASCKNLLSVISNVLDYSKLESNSVPMQLTTTSFNLFGLCEQVLESVVMLHSEKRLSVELSSNIPIHRRHIKADCRCLNQILTNLVGNAIKFTEKGFVRLTVDEVSVAEDSVCGT